MTDTIKISRELLERAATLLQDSLHPPAGCDSFDDWTAQGNALAAELRALLAAQPQASAAQSAPAGEREAFEAWYRQSWGYSENAKFAQDERGH